MMISVFMVAPLTVRAPYGRSSYFILVALDFASGETLIESFASGAGVNPCIVAAVGKPADDDKNQNDQEHRPPIMKSGSGAKNMSPPHPQSCITATSSRKQSGAVGTAVLLDKM